MADLLGIVDMTNSTQDSLFQTFTVHCFFQRWCSHKVTGIDPQANHEEMEAHYRAKHYGVHLSIVEREVNAR